MMKQFSNIKSPVDRADPIPACTWERTTWVDDVATKHVLFWIDQSTWLESGRHPSKLVELCAHEAAHGTGMIWNHIEARLNHRTLKEDEPMAYLIGWLTELLFKLSWTE